MNSVAVGARAGAGLGAGAGAAIAGGKIVAGAASAGGAGEAAMAGVAAGGSHGGAVPIGPGVSTVGSGGAPGRGAGMARRRIGALICRSIEANRADAARGGSMPPQFRLKFWQDADVPEKRWLCR